ncbi:MAG TPA: hypothetical protein VKQ27_05605 [Acetobacteraceae bacterium]|nr:hypothetical protein [Acetobacteraceae bacterium]
MARADPTLLVTVRSPDYSLAPMPPPAIQSADAQRFRAYFPTIELITP